MTLGNPPRLTFLRGYVRPSNISAACNSLSGVFRGHFFFLFSFFVGLFSVVCFLSTDSCLVFVVDDNTAKYPCYSWNY